MSGGRSPNATHRFQAPKGTRDFLPAEMATRRHVEGVWRDVSVRHGFEEVDGPTFEHLDLYTVKSGPGIVSELFSFRREGGDTDYALRPEFTPTLARLYAAAARSLPRPTKWFTIANMFRAERPQRGRLREHIQWNVDVIGDGSPRAEAEVVATTVAALVRLGLTSREVRIRISHRAAIEAVLAGYGIAEGSMPEAFTLVDAVDKLEPEEFRRRALALGVRESRWSEFVAYLALDVPATAGRPGAAEVAALPQLDDLHAELEGEGLLGWCSYRPALARGLAYYTGAVFEVHEASGRERAIAGGGRYDQLVELFDGPPTPAVGLAMGDVVLRLVLEEHGRLRPPEEYLPRPDVFVLNARDDDRVDPHRVVGALRREGFHARQSQRSTRNVGKLLGEAAGARARVALILGRELDDDTVVLKDLDSGDQTLSPLAGLPQALRAILGQDPEGAP